MNQVNKQLDSDCCVVCGRAHTGKHKCPKRIEAGRRAAETRVENWYDPVGVRRDGVTRAYPLKTVRNAPEGMIRDELAGEQVVIQADARGGVAIQQIPDDAQAVHTFWFTWAAYHPETSIYELADE